MKRSLLIALICSMIPVASLFAALNPKESTIEAYTWFRYTGVLDLEKKEPKDIVRENMFGLERGYLRWNHCFTPEIESRVNVDIFSSDEFPDGAGLKLKYGYVDFKGIVQDGKLTVGLQKPYFGVIYDWEYITIQKSLEDKEKVIASADYGVSLNGNIPKGYGEYAIEIINGEGYKNYGSRVNIYPALLANLRVIPLPGITLGGSVLYERSGFLDTLKTEYDQRLLYAGVGRIVIGPLDIWAEYLMADRGPIGKTTKSAGFMVMPILNLKKLTGIDLDLIARLDRWDKDTEKSEDAHMRATGGLNWHIMRRAKGKMGVVLQVNWERTMYEEAGKNPKDAIMAQLRWEFASKPF